MGCAPRRVVATVLVALTALFAVSATTAAVAVTAGTPATGAPAGGAPAEAVNVAAMGGVEGSPDNEDVDGAVAPTVRQWWTNWCGYSWTDAGKCTQRCRSGTDRECGGSQRCYSRVHCR